LLSSYTAVKLWEIIDLSGLCVMLALAAIAFAWISSTAATWEDQMSGKTSRAPSHIESGLSLLADEDRRDQPDQCPVN